MSHTRAAHHRAFSVSRGLVVVIALVPTLVYLFVALRRIGYPYELEWLEGGAVEIAGRVAHGQSIYVAPSLHYVPYPYTPLYFWVSGGLARIMGVGFLPLRLVSLASSLGACALLTRIVWRETGDVVAGIVASGLFTATFAVSGAWLDIGRVDSLALFLLLLTLYRARHAHGVRDGIVVGVLAFLAFFTKQSNLVAMVPVVAMLVVFRRRVGVPALATVAVLVVGSTYLLDASTHGWYGYYVFEELFHQGEVHSVWKTFFTKDLWHAPWAIGLGLAALSLFVLRRGSASTDWLYWGSAVIGLLLSSLVSRLHSGGGQDVLIPAFAATALVGAFGYDALLRVAVGVRAGGDGHRWLAAVPAATGVALAVVVGVQIGALHYSPSRYIPTASDRRAGDRFIASVRRIPGPVIVADHPYYDTLAGKASWAQGEAVHDIMRAGPSRARTDLTASIETLLRSARPVTVLADGPTSAFGPLSVPYFRLTPTKVFDCTRCFFPVTDIKLRPGFLFVRR
ncbi:MAG TPA: glycosyltransferase family 39 protein [Acidimicrobiales bacterium]|nr:glycosyltransferase family 39 protein [Acidimicrobiales bacterium]